MIAVSIELTCDSCSLKKTHITSWIDPESFVDPAGHEMEVYVRCGFCEAGMAAVTRFGGTKDNPRFGILRLIDPKELKKIRSGSKKRGKAVRKNKSK